MLKKAALLAVLVLALPIAALASSVDIINVGGILSTNESGGLTLSGSTITEYNGIVASNLGSVSFSIDGPMTSGTLVSGGTFAAGGTFTIIGNGMSGVPNGTIFNGSFSSPVQWTLITLADGTHNYTLQGAISGGGTVGATIQLTVNTGTGLFTGETELASGDTNLVVPEPGTLSLLGTGLVGLAGVIRRKLNLL